MATPTSHPHPSSYAPSAKQPSSNQTPASASASSPPSYTTTTRSIPSPAYTSTSATALRTPKTPNRPLPYGHYRNGSQHVGHNGAAGAGGGGGTPGKGGTPRGRAGTVSAVASPFVVAEAATGNGNGNGNGSAGAGGMGLGMTPKMGMGMGSGFTPIAMQLTASQGGVSAVLGAMDQEEERRRRLEAIVAMLGGRWGFVSQEGVERCARRLGLECLWDEGMGIGESEAKRTLTIAGTGLIVDVEFAGEVVQGVVLQFEGSGESVKSGAADGAEVLRRDLRAKGQMGYVALDGFVGNLERLATMDRLGGGGVSCFDAVDGLYKSLERVFAWEAAKVKELKVESVEENVLCRQSGRPRLHTNGRVGLSLQYWMDTRLFFRKEPDPGAMDIDTAATTDGEEDEASIWSAIIECEASPAAPYTSIKVSDEWVSEAVEKPTPIQNNGLPIDNSPIDWQEPPPTLLTPESPKNPVDNTRNPTFIRPKLPDVRFVAKFEPPVIVPLQLALDIHESVGSPLTQESLLPTTYENLLFEDLEPGPQLPPNPRTFERTLTTYDPTTQSLSSHPQQYTLFTQPQDYARAITHLPFSHPRQLIALLPTLRQWALASSILRRTLAPTTTTITTTTTPTTNEPSTPPPTTFPSLDAELLSFLHTPLPPSPTPTIQLTLTTSPLPRLALHFPMPTSTTTQPQSPKFTTIAFNINLNGVIDGLDIDDGAALQGQRDADADAERRCEEVRRVLEVGEDIGRLVEWVGRRWGGGGEAVKGGNRVG